MTTISVGGEKYTVKPMNFKTMKKAWPLIMKSQQTEDPMEIASFAIEVMSLAMVRANPEHTADWLEENLSLPETNALGEAMFDLIKDSGLVEAKTGDAGAEGKAQEVETSTETLTPSSPNSSQPVAAVETGTE